MDSLCHCPRLICTQSSTVLREGNRIVEGNPPPLGMENPFGKIETGEDNSIMQMSIEPPENQLDHGHGSSSSTVMLAEQALGRADEDFARLAELTITDDGKKAVVHEHLLSEVSKFFAARRAASK